MKNELYFTSGSLTADASILVKHENTWKLETLARLVDYASPATFGMNQQEVLDPEYRYAKTIKTKDFQTTFEVNKLQNHIKQALGLSDITIDRYRLNIYQAGSFFKSHQDTPKLNNHVGSVVVCLPSQFTGGKLHIEHNGDSHEFDWSEKSDTLIQWVAFFGDCPHSIDKVTSGTRITITYDIFQSENDFVSQNATLKANIQAAIEKLNLEPNKCYGITTTHQYPYSESEEAEVKFKGVDRILLDCLEQTDYQISKGTCLYSEETRETCVVEGILNYCPDLEMYGEGIDFNPSLSDALCGYKMVPDINWIIKPNDESCSVDPLIVHYGNGPCLSYLYTNFVVLINVKEKIL
ncbi:hypothetical protein HDU91_000643 [Kappamyces sp. JEL0680]|nr:hypothetical protein HDU91_000643 [Kappamyces sp. JEL0680]